MHPPGVLDGPSASISARYPQRAEKNNVLRRVSTFFLCSITRHRNARWCVWLTHTRSILRRLKRVPWQKGSSGFSKVFMSTGRATAEKKTTTRKHWKGSRQSLILFPHSKGSGNAASQSSFGFFKCSGPRRNSGANGLCTHLARRVSMWPCIFPLWPPLEPEFRHSMPGILVKVAQAWYFSKNKT